MEVAAAFKWTVSFARKRIGLAVALTTRLPATFKALRAGEIDEYKARQIAEATEVLSDEDVARVEAAIAAQAGGLNPRQLSDRLRRAVNLADPAAAAARAAAKTAARQVIHEHLDDGAGLFTVMGDVERTQLAHDRVRALARQIKTAGDDRTLDQICCRCGVGLLGG